MKILSRAILAAGLVTIAYLLWRLDPASVWGRISVVGWGFALILPFQLFDHMLNALGWRFSFGAEDARRVPFWRLVAARIGGDGVNYLTPSGTIAGEFVRPALLGDVAPESVRNASVVVAKFAQALGQLAFILVGLVFVLLGRLHLLDGRELVLSVCGTMLAIAIIALALAVFTSAGGLADRLTKRSPRLAVLREDMRGYLKRHPGRFMAATIFFMLGFAWGGLEVLLIAHFMRLSVSPLKALAVEVLSNLADSLLFFVPAKIGTQEATKTAIFRVLGYNAAAGLAFGLIRHIREFVWAAGGFAYYAVTRRPGSKDGSLPPPELRARAG
jgi:hypothetical protein